MLQAPQRDIPKTKNFEKGLFRDADKLRKNIDAAEYEHIAPSLVCFKFCRQHNPRQNFQCRQTSRGGQGSDIGVSAANLLDLADIFRVAQSFFFRYMQNNPAHGLIRRRS